MDIFDFFVRIVINFKPVQHNIFPESKHSMSNKLIIRLQPEERIKLVQMSKVPGPGGYRFQPVELKLDIFESYDEFQKFHWYEKSKDDG